MVEIDRWVVAQACQWLAGSPNRPSGPGLTLNLSEESLLDDSLVPFLQEQLASHNIPARRLCFEISENVAARHCEQLHRIVSTLRQRGCRFALDDFGQSFASLIQLQQLPFDYLKLDPSLVRNLLHRPADRSLVAAVHQAARTFGLRTIAEGADTLELLEPLRQLGVDFAQGYALGAPRPVDDLTGG